MKKSLWIFTGLFLTVSLWIVLGNHALKQRSDEIRADLMQGLSPGIEITPEMTGSLPPPVQRYLARSLGTHTRTDVLVRLKHAGWIQINRTDLNPDAADWKYFFAESTYRLDAPSFFWQGMIHLGWEFYLKGWIRYQGAGSEMRWTWMGTLPVWNVDDPQTAAFGLGQMLIQSPWMPTLMLSPDLRWEAIDDTTARAEMSGDSVKTSGVFHFDGEGRILRFETDTWNRATPRGWAAGKRMVKYAYYNSFGDYELPERLFYFVESTEGWVSDADLRLDEIVHE